MVAVRVQPQGGSELVDADPDIEVFTALLEQANVSDNLSLFVRQTRLEFRKLVAAEEVAAAQRRAEAQLLEMPPLPPTEMEPAPKELRVLGEDMVPL